MGNGPKTKDELANAAGFVFDMLCGDAEGRARQLARDIDRQFFGGSSPVPAPRAPTNATRAPSARPEIIEGELIEDDDE